MTTHTRVLLADDHAVLRVGLHSFLEEQPNEEFEVIGEAADGEAALDLVERLIPDVVLLDLSMPRLGGLETTIELRRRGSPVRILVLTQYAEPVVLRRLLESGANGYILKSARGEELVSAIRAVVAGGTYVDPSLAGALVGRQSKETAEASDEELFAKLTPREQQVLKLVAEGYTNKEVASKLDIAVKTVMAHRANLMEKTGIKNHSKLVQFAIRTGLVSVA